MGEVIKFPVEKVRRTTGKSGEIASQAEVFVFEGVQYSMFDQSNEDPATRPIAEPSS